MEGGVGVSTSVEVSVDGIVVAGASGSPGAPSGMVEEVSEGGGEGVVTVHDPRRTELLVIYP